MNRYAISSTSEIKYTTPNEENSDLVMLVSFLQKPKRIYTKQ